MKISAVDLRNFEAVISHYGFDKNKDKDREEIELMRDAYRRDPEAAKATYNALARHIPVPADTRQWVKLSPPPFVVKGKHE